MTNFAVVLINSITCSGKSWMMIMANSLVSTMYVHIVRQNPYVVNFNVENPCNSNLKGIPSHSFRAMHGSTEYVSPTIR